MNPIELEVVRPRETTRLVFEPRRVLNAGYVGRDQAAVRHHIEELRREGVAPPPSVPMLFPMIRTCVTTAAEIETVEERTSGEVEFVLLAKGGKIFAGIGSDHTDRRLEAVDIQKSKQACPNVMGASVWDYEDVRAHWDRLRLQSWVQAAPEAAWVPYQDAPVASILSPEQILDFVRARLIGQRLDDTIIFSGTIPILDGKTIYGSAFRCALADPVLARTLHCTYRVVQLNYLAAEAAAASA